MPIKQAAKKALRQTHKHQEHNLALKNSYRWLVDETMELIANKDGEKALATLIRATKAVDKAAKGHVIHKNKASRIKSQLNRALNNIGAVKATVSKTKKKKK